MKPDGWISIHRCLQTHWLWSEKPFDNRSAWIDLLLSANHKGNKFLLGGELVTVERGQFITSELKLMERWGWSKSKVRRFLDLLQKDEMIVKNSDHKKTSLTIVNYGLYQDRRTTEEPQKNHEETAEEPQRDTNNNELIMSNNENKLLSPEILQMSDKCPDKTPPYKSIVDLDINIDVDKENNIPLPKKTKHKYGQYENVLLTDEDLEKLKIEFSDWSERIERLSEYMASKGKAYKNHLATIRSWSRREQKIIPKAPQNMTPNDVIDIIKRGDKYR